jgi:hypothetical protein
MFAKKRREIINLIKIGSLLVYLLVGVFAEIGSWEFHEKIFLTTG